MRLIEAFGDSVREPEIVGGIEFVPLIDLLELKDTALLMDVETVPLPLPEEVATIVLEGLIDTLGDAETDPLELKDTV